MVFAEISWFNEVVILAEMTGILETSAAPAKMVLQPSISVQTRKEANSFRKRIDPPPSYKV